MPLIHSRSKKAFEHNVEAEMHANPGKKHRAQDLAIAYSVQRRAKHKKMAAGGPVSAKSERRPMPDQIDNDKPQASQVSDKPLHDSSWTDQPTVRQAQSKPKTQPIKHPRMVPSDAFSTRLYNKEGDLEESMAPASPDEQPEADYNELDPKKQGKSPGMSKPHTTAKAYADGGEIKPQSISRPDKGHGAIIHKAEGGGVFGSEDESEAEHAHLSSHVGMEHGEGPEEDEDPDMSPIRESYMSPSESEIMSDHQAMLAEGGMAHEMDMQPESEDEDEHASSVAAAIMAKRAHKMAEGGRPHGDINGHDSIYSDESDQAHLERNAEEDANEEDQTSFNAMRKENYSESEGLKDLDYSSDDETGDMREAHEENDHDQDLVGRIMKKMKRSAMSR